RIDGSDHLVQFGLGQTSGLENLGKQTGAGRKLCQAGLTRFLEHYVQFARRTWQQEDVAAFVFNPKARSGTNRIFQNLRPQEDKRLPCIIGWHFQSPVVKTGLNSFQNALLEYQLLLDDPGNDLFSDIVLSRAKTTRSDNNLRPLDRFSEKLLQAVLVVPHHGFKLNFNANRVELFGQVERVGVDTSSRQQF